MKAIKAIRIFLLILIIIGLGLICTQKIWVPRLVEQILAHETSSQIVFSGTKLDSAIRIPLPEGFLTDEDFAIKVGAPPAVSGGKGKIFFKDVPEMDGSTGNTVAEVYVNDKKITAVGTTHISYDGYSPSGTYYAYREQDISGGGQYTYSINLFNLIDGSYQSVKMPKSEKESDYVTSESRITSFIEGYSWNKDDTLNIISYYVGLARDEHSKNLAYYRISPRKLWLYNPANSTWSLKSLIGQQNTCPEGMSMWSESGKCISISTTTPSNLISDIVPILPKNQSLGKNLVFGTTTIDGITFTILPLYQIKSVVTPDPVDAYDAQTWSRFGDLFFNTNNTFNKNSIDIYRNGSKLKKVQSYYWDKYMGGIYDVVTFTNGDRHYFVLGGANCGNGGCGDDSFLLNVDANRDMSEPVEIFIHNWTWGHNGQVVAGFQGDEKLDFVLSYGDNLFLFPNSNSPIVVVDKNGNVVKKISERAKPLSQLLILK